MEPALLLFRDRIRCIGSPGSQGLGRFFRGLHQETGNGIVDSAGDKSIGIILRFGSRAFKEVVDIGGSVGSIFFTFPGRAGEKLEVHETN